MTAGDLLDSLETLADAPGGIDRLRELVLHLAVRGRLVAQNPHDERPQIDFAAAKKLKRESLWRPSWLPDAPPQWARCPMACLGTWGSGGTPKKGNPDYYGGDIPWLKIGDLNDGLVQSAETHITKRGLEDSSARMIPISAVFLAMYGSIGKSGIAGIECCTNQAIAHCVPDERVIASPYLFRLILALRAELLEQGKGGAQQNISQTVIKHLEVAVPPLQEQHRIVARVDELMALLDRLEAAKEARDATRAQLRDAALAALQDANDAEEVKTAWSRIADHMHDLFTDPADVPPLRQTILQLGIRGLLVPQDASEPPASSLLNEVKAEGARLLQEHGVRAKSPPSSIADDEPRFSLPAGWEWCRLQTLVDPTRGISYGVIKLGSDPGPTGVKILRCSDVRFRTIDERNVRHIEPSLSEEYGRTVLRGGELLVNVRGTLGGCAVVPDHMAEWNIAREVAVIPTICVNPGYLLEVLAAPYFQVFTDSSLRGIAYKGLNLGLLRELLIPLPPLAEQARIVARLREMMALLDRLETTLRSSHEVQEAYCMSAVRALPEERVGVNESSPIAVG